MSPIRPQDVRYIKLGAAGRWEARALERGEIYFGMPADPQHLIDQGDWDGMVQHFRQAGRTASVAKYFVRESYEFQTLPADCLWITFSRRYLWWGFADPKVTFLGGDGSVHGTRMRRIIGGWRNTDIRGGALAQNGLSTKLTAVAACRNTMCGVKERDYLLRKINGEEEPLVAQALEARRNMIALVSEAIAALHWADFEDLADLIFARTGWQRVSRVGGAQKDIDLEIVQPTTQERAFVQVKSRAGQPELENSMAVFDKTWDRMFFVCHTPIGKLDTHGRQNVHVWTRNTLASATVRAGLCDWVLEKIA